jgi:hypoxanthine phosphoribosyltransferase
MKLDASETWRLLEEAELICDEDAVDAAVNRVADEITREIRDRVPLVLSVMGGGVVFTGQLLPRLRFPLEFDYVHVTRYRGGIKGGDIDWIVQPRTSVAARTVLSRNGCPTMAQRLSTLRFWPTRRSKSRNRSARTLSA